MKINGKGKSAERAKESVEKIVKAFEAGEIPEKLAQIYLKVKDNKPSARWSIRNQLIQLLSDASDGRGFQDWKKVGRCVKKGGNSFGILAPCLVKDNAKLDANGKPTMKLIGFRGVNVWDVSETVVIDQDLWDKHAAENEETNNHLENLPLLDVAKEWGLEVSAVSTRDGRALGWYMPGKAIGVGVENLSTWTHELIHAADDKKGNLTERGQHWRSECVAELGGATLLMALGYEKDADLGGAFEYIQKYAKAAKLETLSACMKVLTRVTAAVSLVLETAEKIEQKDLTPA